MGKWKGMHTVKITNGKTVRDERQQGGIVTAVCN